MANGALPGFVALAVLYNGARQNIVRKALSLHTKNNSY
jgi:hypothetical protein